MRIYDALKEAQDGRVHDNLARAFHLPPEKVDVAVATALSACVTLLRPRLEARKTLAALVDLIGQGAYEQVLDTPVLLGAPHTQVLGADALKVVAGHTLNEQLARSTADASDVSEMISEYLLPVIAALLIGSLSKLSRQALDTIASGDTALDLEALVPAEGTARPLHLPRVSGGVGFSGSAAGSAGFVPATGAPSRYLALAQAIEKPARGRKTSDTADPAPAVRYVLSACLAGTDETTDPAAPVALEAISSLFGSKRS
jgi:hypothetical protein